MLSPEPFCSQETKCISNDLGMISMIKSVQYLIIFPPLVKVLPVRSMANKKHFRFPWSSKVDNAHYQRAKKYWSGNREHVRLELMLRGLSLGIRVEFAMLYLGKYDGS